MNIAAVFIAYFGIKETQFHPDTGVWRGQYYGLLSKYSCILKSFWMNRIYAPVVYKKTEHKTLLKCH